MGGAGEAVDLLEELAANAWPAAVAQRVDGWLFRYAAGVTRRANSVWPNAAAGRVPLAEKITLAEAFYARRGLPTRFQVSPAACPPDLDTVLADRGYRWEDRTAVQTCPVATVLAGAAPAAAGTPGVVERLEESWLAAYRQAEGFGEDAAIARRGVLERIGPRAGFALLRRDGAPAAVGLGVAERGWLGLFCMATHPECRRQGAATAIVHTLARWGQTQGAAWIYLQVVETNGPAVSFYHRLGFETRYHYHYRRLEAGGGARFLSRQEPRERRAEPDGGSLAGEQGRGGAAWHAGGRSF